jgi:hypothetical protein
VQTERCAVSYSHRTCAAKVERSMSKVTSAEYKAGATVTTYILGIMCGVTALTIRAFSRLLPPDLKVS